MTESQNKYDLEERTAKFGEMVIIFCKTFSQNAITKPLMTSSAGLEPAVSRPSEDDISGPIHPRSIERGFLENDISQVVRSATSIGANYMEANGASSKKDFRNKIYTCKKESQETKHWLRMLKIAVPQRKDEIQKLWQESQELTLIFGKIVSKLKN